MEDPSKVVDKGYAWLVLFVAVIYNMIEAMLFFSSTIYMVEWDNTFDVSKAQLGMAGALMNGFTCFTGEKILLGWYRDQKSCHIRPSLINAVDSFLN